IIHVKDAVDRQFTTLLTNDLIIGEGNKPSISMLKDKGIKLTISEEYDRSVFKKLNQKYNKFLKFTLFFLNIGVKLKPLISRVVVHSFFLNYDITM
ncbi:hypothetical protein C2G38_2268601, partial [Gigaspora rosea]